MGENIISLDPGKYKTGIAVVNITGDLLDRRVVKTEEAAQAAHELCSKYSAGLFLIGKGGPGRSLEKKIASMNPDQHIIFVNEKGSSLEARKVYWKLNKPRGLFRLVPRGLLTPPVPVDDYAALIIALRYLKPELSR